MQRFSSAGAFEAEIGVGQLSAPGQVAVDSTGRVYALEASVRIVRFTAGGDFDVEVGTGQIQLPFTMTVSPADDHVFVTAFDPDFALLVYELDDTGNVVDGHGLRPVQYIAGLSLAGDGDHLYATDGQGSRVSVLSDAGSPVPTVTLDPVTDLEANSVTFNGRVDPNGGLPTAWRFEYSTDGVDWLTTSGGEVPVGDGDVPVSDPASGLLADTEYRVRLVATKEAFGGPTATSAELTFTTPPAAAGGAGAGRRQQE